MRTLLLSIFFFTSSFLLFGCSSPARDSHNSFKVVNLRPEFREFWKKSKGQPFEVQLRNWDRIVEGPHQDLFDVMVNNRKYDAKWKQHRLERLKERFAYFEEHYPQVEHEFDRFESLLHAQLARFSHFFPEMRLKMPIYAVPGATFNGKLGSVNSDGDLGLAFGIDMMLILENNPDVLYAHEIFHLYHVDRMRITPEYYESEARFTLPLWIEGLGTHVSQVLNPDAPSEDILMQRDLASLDAANTDGSRLIRALSWEYLKLADRKLGQTDPSYRRRRAWFGSSSVHSELPQRIGYLLGFRVARHLATYYSLDEMISWSPEEAHIHIKDVLVDLSDPARALMAGP
jgi:hypothetical protein